MKNQDQDLVKMIQNFLNLRKEIKEIDALVVPPFIHKPIACKKQEWDEYQLKKQQYDEAVKTKGTVKNQKEKELEELIDLIVKSLPSSNIWFITDCETYAVGHQTNDWPSSKGDLRIIEKPVIKELKPLNHVVVN